MAKNSTSFEDTSSELISAFTPFIRLEYVYTYKYIYNNGREVDQGSLKQGEKEGRGWAWKGGRAGEEKGEES